MLLLSAKQILRVIVLTLCDYFWSFGFSLFITKIQYCQAAPFYHEKAGPGNIKYREKAGPGKIFDFVPDRGSALGGQDTGGLLHQLSPVCVI